MPYIADSQGSYTNAEWIQSSIFWFGTNELGLPGRNYADVRIGYSNAGIHLRFTVIDYYLWYGARLNTADDLTRWDTVAVAFDTDPSLRADAPNTDDYSFFASANNWQQSGNSGADYRDARGNGAGWDTSWDSRNWRGSGNGEWAENPGYNDNSGRTDFGHNLLLTIAWEALGLDGPPAEGVYWGMSAYLFDRDTASETGVTTPQAWPAGASREQPSTWGLLRFGAPVSAARAIEPDGTVSIRAKSLTSSTSDNTVEDAWIGGGGTCSGGHEGENETNHGNDKNLFSASQTLVADFPCFSKSYLRFHLDEMPEDKIIVSATLTLRHWSNSGLPNGPVYDSHIHLYTVPENWEEATIHWNNAPMPLENISSAWMHPKTNINDTDGVPYSWDATKAVIEAYAAGKPVNLALYSSDTEFHSSKYLHSSETPDFYAANRPTLTIEWANP